MGTGSEYFSCQFTRLGYLSLDSNERSAYKARELKSVYLKARGGFMKFLLHKCHVNSLNLQNQVGLIALNILGAPQAQARGGPPPGYGPGAGYGGPPGAGGSLIPRPGAYTQRCVHLLSRALVVSFLLSHPRPAACKPPPPAAPRLA